MHCWSPWVKKWEGTKRFENDVSPRLFVPESASACLSVCLSLTAYILSIHTCFREISLSNDMASSDVSIAILASKLCCLDTKDQFKWYRNFGELICLVKILLQLNDNGETKKNT